MRYLLMRCLVAIVCGLIILWNADPSPAASLSDNDMVDFLAQSLCLDPTGKSTAQVPIVDNCTRMRPQRADDAAVYQKHDWPDQRVYPHYFLTGHQASDAVLINRAGGHAVEQTMDFGGDRQHHFGYFDYNDAGQVVVMVGGWASVAMTQDAKGGVQWFIGSGCKKSAEGAKLGWLLFNRTVPTGSWATTVANLRIMPSASDCPVRFTPSYTRYRREQVVFPFRLVRGNAMTTENLPLDLIIVEHFAGAAPDPASNPSLERFFFARHLGMVRWERWENLAHRAILPRRAKDDELAQTLVASSRCPSVQYSVPPGPGWRELGCRTWTTIVKLTKPWSVKDYDWRAAKDAVWP